MLTEHWNGTTWTQVAAPAVLHQDESLLAVGASPDVGGNDNLLNGVSATTGDVWTVGSSDVFAHTLALRETGWPGRQRGPGPWSRALPRSRR